MAKVGKTGSVVIVVIGLTVATIGVLTIVAEVLDFRMRLWITGGGILFVVLGVRAFRGNISW